MRVTTVPHKLTAGESTSYTVSQRSLFKTPEPNGLQYLVRPLEGIIVCDRAYVTNLCPSHQADTSFYALVYTLLPTFHGKVCLKQFSSGL